MSNIEKTIEALKKYNVFKTDGAPGKDALKAVVAAWPEAYPESICGSRGRGYALCGRGAEKKLVIVAPGEGAPAFSDTGFAADDVKSVSSGGEKFAVATCSPTAANAAALRKEFPFTAPVAGGIKTAIGLGDRIGNATPGHIRAVKGYDVFPILPQQSIREMHRTCRTPRDVMDDVSWAVFQEGFRRPFGADADHLKDEEAVRITVPAGFTMFTIDPSDYINDRADSMGDGEMAECFERLFKGDTASRDAMIGRYMHKRFMLKDDVTGYSSNFNIKPREIIKIAVKYLPAVRHVIKLAKLIAELKAGQEFDLEMSVDETATPTTPEAHLFVAVELKEAGIAVQSLAPRFVGQFQKGIDFIGDIDEFTRTCQLHALIARAMGPYKLSIHSGSDKFSIFPIVGRLTAGLFHEKTAGTSYLEAIRVVTRRAPALYREIHAYSLERFETDRASYHVTTNLANVPPLDSLSDAELPALMDKIDSRQLIHITYGSVLTEADAAGKPRFRDRLLAVLNENEEEHYATLAAHVVHHIDSLGIKKI